MDEQQVLDLDDHADPSSFGFRGPAVCRIVGITYRQLDYWVRTDLIRPSIADARGSGTQRVFGYPDLVEIKVIKSLLDAGLALPAVRKVIGYIRQDLDGDVGSANLVVDGKESVLVRTGDELIDAVRRGQGVLNILPLSGVVGELEAAIHELRPGDGADVTPLAHTTERAAER